MQNLVKVRLCTRTESFPRVLPLLESSEVWPMTHHMDSSLSAWVLEVVPLSPEFEKSVCFLFLRSHLPWKKMSTQRP